MTKRHFLGTVAALGLMAGGAAAQDIINLEEVTFSANLTPTELARAASSVSVVTREDLEADGTTQLVDYLAKLPGVTVTQNGGPGGSASLRIRGAGPEYVAVYVDGIRVDDPSSPQTAFNFGTLSTADIGRVEVLRGSQSALYGGSAVGGVVNITTLGATEDGFSQSLQAEVGSYNSQLLRYGLAFRDDRFEAALNFSHTRTDGFSSHEPFPGAPGLTDDGHEATRLSLSGRYQLTDTFALGVSGFVQDSTSEYDDFGADADNLLKRREYGARVFGEYSLGNSVHEISATLYDLEREAFQPRGTSAGVFEAQRISFAYKGVTEYSPALTFIYGADTQEESITVRGQGPDSNRVSGVFGQVLWTPRDDLDISATLRADHNSGFGTFYTGRIAAAWQATEALTLRGAAGRGFRAPSINEQLGNPVFSIAPNTGLAPETSISAEIGADYRFANGAELSATLFQLSTDNAISYCALTVGAFGAPCPVAGPVGFTNQYQNVAGETRRRGLELAAGVPVTDQHDLSLAYTYTDARNPAGGRLARIPYHDLNVTLKSDWTETFSSQIGLQHVGGRTGGLGDYTVVNASMRYRLTDNADLLFRIENLLNEQYQKISGYGTSDRAFYLGLSSRF
ncbi:Colicin I receptor [Roseibaca ekhonensis]|uniref:Colicin I receptor n=1 Tax=Roseinatronobacter ekhonensis TaxID=254356 RepID=A0A3B0M4V7_9RHOB|nr:TonB-dependent receptor [Roseibaca ekhonensis]SUZ30550.1 Colicin I receptor [Roseibaca ekhonensis]